MTNRKIKFRFFIHSEKRMIDAIGFCMESATQIRIWYMGVHRDGDPMIMNESFAFHDVAQMQLVGTTDVKGKDVYEGDVISSKSHSPSRYLIQFIEGGFCATHPSISGYRIDINHFYPSVGTDIEIIGNIFQNPEFYHELGKLRT